MSVVEYFEQLQSEFRSATPWPWPLSMSEHDLAFVREAMPDLTADKGAIFGDRFVVYGELRGEHGAFEFKMGDVLRRAIPFDAISGYRLIDVRSRAREER